MNIHMSGPVAIREESGGQMASLYEQKPINKVDSRRAAISLSTGINFDRKMRECTIYS